MIPYGYERSTRVEFQEDGQVITMTVDQDEEENSQGGNNSLYNDTIDAVDYEDDEYDQEVSFKENSFV